MSEAYVLPESNVYLLVKVDDHEWEVWEGFKVGKIEKIQAYKHGSITTDGLELYDDSISLRTNLQGITLKATTVVRTYLWWSKIKSYN